MSLSIKLNGVDVTSKMELTNCVLYDRYGGMLDSISLEFPESTDVSFYRYDEIEIKRDTFRSGLMYVDESELISGRRVVNALSAKHSNKNQSSGLLKHIRLLALAKSIAAANGLTLKTYGVTDFVYDSLTRICETDLKFLSRVCQREGYAIKIDDGNLIIFNERYMENDTGATPLTITASEVDPSYTIKRATNGLSCVTVKFFDLSDFSEKKGEAFDEDINGGSKTITERVKDFAEAERFARGYLREANKNYITGILPMELRTDISAGTILKLSGFKEYDGKYIVTEAAHNIVREKTFLKIRGTLNY